MVIGARNPILRPIWGPTSGLEPFTTALEYHGTYATVSKENVAVHAEIQAYFGQVVDLVGGKLQFATPDFSRHTDIYCAYLDLFSRLLTFSPGSVESSVAFIPTIDFAMVCVWSESRDALRSAVYNDFDIILPHYSPPAFAKAIALRTRGMLYVALCCAAR